MNLANEIAAFGTLVGLLLALAALLTANRASALTDLKGAATFKGKDKWREFWLDVLLGVVTLLVWLGGLPLAIRAGLHLDPLGSGGPLRSVFLLTWILLLGLIGWQASLAVQVFKLEVPPPAN